MMLNFCTLFNSNYLSRGLVMYESLLKYCDDFHLYIFAFDKDSFNYLKSKNQKNLTVVSLKEFEDDKLLRVKANRTLGEYCWTCTSSTILFCLQKFNLSNCTDIDSDLVFFSNPKVLIDEMGDKSVLITEHRYTREYDQSIESGKYCVQFVTFINNENGLKVLNWWRNACIDWCYNRVEEGKFGDQKYLDDWTTRFEGVHELKHLGGGIAPWNVQQYNIIKLDGKYFGKEISTKKKFEIVFFHFHGLKFYEDGIVSFTDKLYSISIDVQRIFYIPYVNALNRINGRIEEEINKAINANGVIGKAPVSPMSFNLKFRYYISSIKASFRNVTGKELRNRIAHHYFYYFRDFKND